MISMLRFMAAASFLIALGGCTSISINEVAPRAAYVPENTVLWSVIDSRDYLDRYPDTFAGTYIAGFGIPRGEDVSRLTRDPADKGKPLARFLAERLSAGLADSGWKAREIQLKTIPSVAEADLLLSGESRYLLIISVKEWFFRTTAYTGNVFDFNTRCDVYVFEKGVGQPDKKSFGEDRYVRSADVVSPNSGYSVTRENGILLMYRRELERMLNDDWLASRIR